MAVALPNFAEFDVHSDGAVGTRWKKWLARFRNLLLALDVDDAKRQRALLLHYAGESVSEIFETLSDVQMLVKTKTHSERQLQRLQTTLPRKRIENTKYMCFVKPSKKVTKVYLSFTLVYDG